MLFPILSATRARGFGMHVQRRDHCIERRSKLPLFIAEKTGCCEIHHRGLTKRVEISKFLDQSPSAVCVHRFIPSENPQKWSMTDFFQPPTLSLSSHRGGGGDVGYDERQAWASSPAPTGRRSDVSSLFFEFPPGGKEVELLSSSRLLPVADLRTGTEHAVGESSA